MISKLAKIQKYLNEGRHVEAEISLDLFLKFGPNNMEALKMKAFLYAQRGLFAKEYDLWIQMAQLSPDDEDVMDFFESHFFEEKEHFYFTDLLPDGGRRFLLHPRDLLESCGIGFITCLIFIYLSSIPIISHFLSSPFIAFLFVGLFVILPWIGIVKAYFKMPGEVYLNSYGLTLSTRFKRTQFRWDEMEQVFVAHKLRRFFFALEVIVVPKDKQKELLRIDISQANTIVKARRYFLAEVLSYFPKARYVNFDRLSLNFKKKNIL